MPSRASLLWWRSLVRILWRCPTDSDFWRDVTAFVAAFSAAQQAALALEQVTELFTGLGTTPKSPALAAIVMSRHTSCIRDN